jgi:hypothetical protein
LIKKGLKLVDELQIANVDIVMPDGKKEFIHTLICGNKNKDILVCIHGYGGSGCTYYRMLHPLSMVF